MTAQPWFGRRETHRWRQVPWYVRGCGRSVPRSQIPAVYCPLLPQCVLCDTSLQGEAGGQNAQGDPCPGEQESCQGESPSRGGATALYEAERGCQEDRGWY